MRVLHVITRLIVGGAQENTLASVVGLGQLPDVQVQLVSGPTTGPEGSLEAAASRLPGGFLIVPGLVRPVSPWRDWMAWRRLTRLFREQQPDIVHTHSGKAGVLGRLAAHRAGVRIIVHTIHGPSFGSFQGVLANRLFLMAEKRAAKVTTHFVAVAHAMSRQYLAAGIGRPDQFTRIFSGFDLAPFLAAANDEKLRARYGIGPFDLVVGKIARLFQLKGHDDLIDAASSMVEQCQRIKFLLVGDGAWRGRLERRVREKRLQGHFIFTGLVPPLEVPPLIGIMDLLVHLSHREGLARALPQALAAGKPIVAYDCDGAGEVCLENETGFLVQPGDKEQLVRQVMRLARDPTLRGQLGQRGQQLVREWFPVEKMVSALYALYQQLLRA